MRTGTHLFVTRARAAVVLTALLLGLLAGVPSASAVGPTVQAPSPSGRFDFQLEPLTSPGPGSIRIAGSVVDTASPSAQVNVRLLVSSHGVTEGKEIGAARDGFARTVTTERHGSVLVAVFATSAPGSAEKIWEGRVDVVSVSPLGNLDEAIPGGAGKVSVTGWAADVDAKTSPVSVGIYVDGTLVSTVSAGQPYPYLVAFLPGGAAAGWDNNHRFTAQVAAPPGERRVCARATNLGARGSDSELSCKTVTVPAAPETTITGSEKQGAAYAFLFDSDRAGRTFQCQWDGGAWNACTSPASAVLPSGSHTFAVRALNEWGEPDPTPATREFDLKSPPLTSAAIALGVKAVKKKGKLRVSVRPRSTTDDYVFQVQKKRKKKWKNVTRVRTKGPRDVKVINLRKGRYRVVIKNQHGLVGTTSQTVRLKR